MGKATVRPYSGEEDDYGEAEDPGRWLDHFEMTCRANEWDDDAKKILKFPVYLVGEAEDWYHNTREWIDASGRKWSDVKGRFIARFRPVGYLDEIEDRLRAPVQMINESVRGYAGRYEKLHRQAGETAGALDSYRRHWIGGLAEELKVDVLLAAPKTFKAAMERALLRENVANAVKRDKRKVEAGKQPQPEEKHQSVDTKPAEEIVDEATRVGRSRRNLQRQDTDPINDPKFPEFYKAMNPEIEKYDPSVDELVDRFKAWKMLTRVYTDPAVIKAKVLKSMVVKEGGSTPTNEGPTCYHCKERGHVSKNCPKKPAFKCYVCGEEGHGAKMCPKGVNGNAASTSTSAASEPKEKDKEKKKVSAKQAKVKKSKKHRRRDASSEEDEDSDEIVTAFMARPSKRKQPEVMVETDGPERVEKVKKTSKRNRARKTMDPDVVSLFRDMQVPLNLVVRHGAAFEAMAKRALKEVYDEGRAHRKKLNPIMLSSKLSHALTIHGTFADVPCERLIIDPGCTVSMLDVNLARRAKIGIKKKTNIVIMLADGGTSRPIGQTANKEIINVRGLKVALRMPVVDSKNSYDILLGRDWLKQTKAIGDYSKNSYKIRVNGRTEKLQGRKYSKSEVVLTDSSSEGSSETTTSAESTSEFSDESSSDETESESGSETDSEDEEGVAAFRAEILQLDNFDVRPRRHEGRTSTRTKCGSRKGKQEKVESRLLQVEQLREIDINPELESEQRKQVEDLLWEFREGFATSMADMGHSNVVEHEINLKPGARPFYCPGTRRFAPPELEAIRKGIEEEITTGKIIEYDGPWCAPIVLAKKKDGSFRKCVAYNGLNDRTERESWPLPNIEELLERLAGHAWYSACDGFMGYYSVKIREEDVGKTMFKTPFGTFAYTVMPFGLKNAPHTYSRVTAKTFEHLIGKTLEAYIDDTATYSNTFEEHLAHLRRTLGAARKTGIKLKASKCHFCYPEIEFVGHLVSKAGIRMMPDKVERVQNWPVPSDRTKLKGFLGLTGYYRRLIKGFATLAFPLNRLTSLKVSFEWGAKEQQAFEALKTAMTTAPVLRKPDYGKDWVLEVDASDIALGAVLGQEDEDDTEIHPVYYWSRQLSRPERNYSVTDRECLAVVAACKKLRPYILGRKVVIVGDHTAVKWILNKTEISGRHARWKIMMSEFDYEVRSRPGNQNGNADALSRLAVGGGSEEVDDEPEIPGFRATVLRTKWVDDAWYKDVYLWLETLVIQKDSAQERDRIRKRALRFAVGGKKLYYRDADGGLKLCLSKDEIKEVLLEYHEGAVGGHFGRDVTVGRVREKFWWPTLWRDVVEHVKTCENCQRYGPRERHNALQPFQPVYPFEIIFMDFVVNLPMTPHRNRHLITMTEGLTKWVEARPVKEATAASAAKFLMEEIVQRFGVPTVVITDNGTHFKKEFHELCEKMGIAHRYATAYHPQTNGQDERTNGLLLNRIRRWRLEDYSKWDIDMPASVLACNTRKVSTTSFSPMESLMGYTAGTASSLKHGGMTKKELKARVKLVVDGVPEKVTGMRLRVLESLRDEAVRVKGARSQQMKVRYDKKVHERTFEVGDEVLVYDSSLLKQWSRKLDERWEGPYEVMWKGELGAYSVSKGGKTKLVSGDQMKRYYRREV